MKTVNFSMLLTNKYNHKRWEQVKAVISDNMSIKEFAQIKLDILNDIRKRGRPRLELVLIRTKTLIKRKFKRTK